MSNRLASLAIFQPFLSSYLLARFRGCGTLETGRPGRDLCRHDEYLYRLLGVVAPSPAHSRGNDNRIARHEKLLFLFPSEDNFTLTNERELIVGGRLSIFPAQTAYLQFH